MMLKVTSCYQLIIYFLPLTAWVRWKWMSRCFTMALLNEVFLEGPPRLSTSGATAEAGARFPFSHLADMAYHQSLTC